MKKIMSSFFVLVSLFTLVSADADDYGMYGMMSGNYGFGGMFYGWIIGLLVVVILVLIIVLLIKQIQKK
ncbi:MAG: hypothetical protein V1889_02310 [archaeon]